LRRKNEIGRRRRASEGQREVPQAVYGLDRGGREVAAVRHFWIETVGIFQEARDAIVVDVAADASVEHFGGGKLTKPPETDRRSNLLNPAGIAIGTGPTIGDERGIEAAIGQHADDAGPLRQLFAAEKEPTTDEILLSGWRARAGTF
jgi:hypothetical protein